MAAIVQACTKAPPDIVCAVTLFPVKWQDYELIGPWKLGSVPDAKRGHQPHSDWRPAKELEREFAYVTVESRKDMTVEIRAASAAVCNPSGTTITEADQFFAMRGRVLGEQRTVPQEMRLRIDNAGAGFAGMMKEACLAQPGT
jgi:hypothetical protein